VILLRWFLSSKVIETFRTNVSVRLAERSDTRELSGEALIEALRKAGL
jgi:hypothetical protein